MSKLLLLLSLSAPLEAIKMVDQSQTLLKHTPAVGMDICGLIVKDHKSDAECIDGFSMGCIGPYKMWVDRGCRAEFICAGHEKKCESKDDEYETCECEGYEDDLEAHPLHALAAQRPEAGGPDH